MEKQSVECFQVLSGASKLLSPFTFIVYTVQIQYWNIFIKNLNLISVRTTLFEWDYCRGPELYIWRQASLWRVQILSYANLTEAWSLSNCQELRSAEHQAPWSAWNTLELHSSLKLDFCRIMSYTPGMAWRWIFRKAVQTNTLGLHDLVQSH